VRSAAHFEVDREAAQRLLGDVARMLPGYLVPRLAEEIAGAAAKVTYAPQL
jgi:L-lysine 2,3-aminomutase